MPVVIDNDETLHANARGDASKPHRVDHGVTNELFARILRVSSRGGSHSVHAERVA
jgi:hypothetical protein